jgi:hypothetical protein
MRFLLLKAMNNVYGKFYLRMFKRGILTSSAMEITEIRSESVRLALLFYVCI